MWYRLTLFIALVLTIITGALMRDLVPTNTAPAAMAPETAPSRPLTLTEILLPAPPVATAETPASPVIHTIYKTDKTDKTDKQQSGTTEAEGISIHIQWPAEPGERHRIRQTLHQCLGVRLAKIDDSGQILAMEASAQSSFSQYARQFDQAMDQTDTRLVKSWSRTPGKIVRLYPIKLDQALFRAFRMNSGQHSADITGRFRWQANSLIMSHVTINKMVKPGLMTLYRGSC